MSGVNCEATCLKLVAIAKRIWTEIKLKLILLLFQVPDDCIYEYSNRVLQGLISFRILAEGKQNQIKWDDGGAKKF